VAASSPETGAPSSAASTTLKAASLVADGANQAAPSSSGATVLALEVTAALAALATSRLGLDDAEAARRRATMGPNVLPAAVRRSVLREVAAQFTNMFVIVLVVAAGLTFLTYRLTTPRDVATLELAIGILCVVALNAMIGFIQEHAAERTAEALQSMVAHTTRVLRAGRAVEVPAEDLVGGDVIVLDAGDAVPADCRVIEAHNLSVEMSALTGESRPVGRTVESANPDAAPIDARDAVFMGTSIATGSGKAVVYATGLATQFGQIYRLTAEQPEEPSPLQRQITDMARRVAAVAIGAGLALFGLRSLAGSPLERSFVFALGVMVALVPEGLPATLSVSLAIGVRRMARRHALIRRLAAVEALGSTTVICTDKTGTLTTAEMTLQRVYTPGHLARVSGVGYAPVGTVDDAAAVSPVLRVGALCSDARLLVGEGGWRVLGDTTEGAILVAAAKAGIDVDAEAARTPRVGVFPFDADRKMMSTLHQVDGRVELYLKGSPEAVLERSTSIGLGPDVRALDDSLRDQVTASYDEMAREGLRVLAIAYRALASSRVGQDDAERDLTFLGLVGIADAPRTEVTAAVAACHGAGLRIIMVTGDYGLTAEAVARHVGILEEGPARVVTGRELDSTDDADLAALLRGDEQVVFARVRPEHKLRIVIALEGLGEVVAVTGDGANDAPALRHASVGVAMGVGGTDVARAAAVVVLLDDSFASIAAAIELGRAVYRNIQRFLVYIFSHNLAELAPILVATAVGFPLVPLSALQVLAIDLGSDVLPALALGAERPEADTMSRPPRPPSEHLFSWAVIRRFLFLGSIQSIGVVAAFFWKIHSAHLGFDQFTASTPAYREAVTMTQAGIVVSQFFNSFAVRTERQSVLAAGLFSNPPLVAAGVLALGFMAAVSYVPVLQAVFHTAALSVVDWLVLVGFGALLLVADEVRKALHRRAERRRQLVREA
jgi:P-type Ca2+ transporter type 2C